MLVHKSTIQTQNQASVKQKKNCFGQLDSDKCCFGQLDVLTEIPLVSLHLFSAYQILSIDQRNVLNQMVSDDTRVETTSKLMHFVLSEMRKFLNFQCETLFNFCISCNWKLWWKFFKNVSAKQNNVIINHLVCEKPKYPKLKGLK